MAVSQSASAPYAPASAIIEFIDRYRNRGLTKPFTAEVLSRAGVSQSLVPRTIQALQVLELMTEDGMPTETLEALRRAPEPELKAQMAAWLRAVYADVFAFVDPTDDESAIRDAFRSYNPVGQQPRMVALFMGLCRAAGLRTDAGAKESRPRPSARKPLSSASSSVARVKSPGESAATRSGHAPMAGLPPALAGLLNSLPAAGKWTTDERDRFLRTFSAVLDFCYVVDDRAEDDAE